MKKKRIAIGFFSVLLIFLGTLAVITSMIFHKYEAPGVKESDALFEKIKDVQFKGGTIEITDDDINSQIKALLTEGIKKDNFEIKDIFTEISENQLSVYAGVKYDKYVFYPNVSGEVSYENEKLIFKPSKIRIGSLPLSKSKVLSEAGKYVKEGINITDEKIEIARGLLPLKIKSVKIEDEKIKLEVEKLKLTDIIFETITAEENKESTNKADSKTNQKSQGTTKTEGKAADNSEAASLLKIRGQLNKVMGSLSTSKQKNIVSRIQSTLGKVASNPDYQYKRDAQAVQSMYSSLSNDERRELKTALIKNVDITTVMKLVNIFGM
ncbi:hypothetical protein Q428_02590 [Fervidicella metallireducens AeB]|uniref:Uncharacterized protein n=1 Tax=Fervidicella metallireducens AeB TaxID=1403537 RepID=A0A017RYN5_9CLOT|nr:hypothetical protein [Fervidicella metallireducens]EYE89509.1 hypothetical protein Q428_02590 [Fervidicella metallireducens AeB]